MNRTMFGLRRCAFGGFLCLSFVVIALAEDCDKLQCKGPLRFYEDLKCTPIYEKPGDCCAIRYDCSHLRKDTCDQCIVNGHEYGRGEVLRDEDRSSPCDIGCYCDDRGRGPTFVCASVDCFARPKPGCYLKHSIDSCCGGEEICPQGKEDGVKCEVDGEIYKDGQKFYPKGYPKLSCVCAEGYKGENVAPFCREMSCGTELRHAEELRENSPPVYYSGQSPKTDCSFAHRSQNPRDVVISNGNVPNQTPGEGVADDMKCKFGNLTLAVGDELNQATHYDSVCVKCVCEVPPTLTCQRLPDNVCDVTIHPDFSKYD